MQIPIRTTFLGELDEPGGARAPRFLDDDDEEFLEAFCELLEIQARRNGEPIIVLPDGPVTQH